MLVFGCRSCNQTAVADALIFSATLICILVCVIIYIGIIYESV